MKCVEYHCENWAFMSVCMCVWCDMADQHDVKPISGVCVRLIMLYLDMYTAQ